MSQLPRDHASPPDDPFPRAIFLTLILVTLCLRVIGLMVRHEYLVPQYVGTEAGVIAHHIVSGQGFASPFDAPFDAPGNVSPSTYLPPAYPYLLAGLMARGSHATFYNAPLYYDAVAINLIFAALLPAIVLAIGQTAGFPRPVSLLAALGACLCPEALRAPGFIGDEAIFATLSALFIWWMLQRLRAPQPPAPRHSIWMGLASGLLALLNPAMALALPISWLAALRLQGTPWKKLCLHATLFAAMTFVGTAPWLIRNTLFIHPPAYAFVSRAFWIDTWSNLHPNQRVTSPDGHVESLPLHPWNGTDPMSATDRGITRPLSEAQYIDATRQKVLTTLQQNPAAAARYLLDQLNAFWLGIAEANRWDKNPWIFFLAQGLPALLGIAGLIAARKRIAPPVLAFLLTTLLVFPLPCCLSGASARYRHPIDLILFIGCAWLAWTILQRIRPTD